MEDNRIWHSRLLRAERIHLVLLVSATILSIAVFFLFPTWGERSGDDFVPLVWALVQCTILLALWIVTLFIPKDDGKEHKGLRRFFMVVLGAGAVLSKNAGDKALLASTGEDMAHTNIRRQLSPAGLIALLFLQSLYVGMLLLGMPLSVYTWLQVALLALYLGMLAAATVWSHGDHLLRGAKDRPRRLGAKLAAYMGTPLILVSAFWVYAAYQESMLWWTPVPVEYTIHVPLANNDADYSIRLTEADETWMLEDAVAQLGKGAATLIFSTDGPLEREGHVFYEAIVLGSRPGSSEVSVLIYRKYLNSSDQFPAGHVELYSIFVSDSIQKEDVPQWQ